jgi:hypothetical protein
MRPRHRWGVVLVALGALGLGARPAAADPPRPTDYRSTVTAVDPAAEGVEAAVVGGDAFLELRVDEGHEVLVEGYGDEPYLRFLPDGTVERNRRSEATYLNDDRQGTVELPPEADNAADPDWQRVAGDGTYAWHDHRIHWMGTSRPPGAEPGDVVQEWAVALTVDGTPTEVRGELVLVEGVSALPWLALGVAGLAVVVVLGRRRPLVVAAVAAVVAAAGALVVGWGQYSVAPAGSGVNPLLVAVPLVGLVAAVAGLVLRDRSSAPTATLAAAAAVLGWGALRASVLWMPVLPTELPYALDRAVTALALGLSVAAAGLVVWSGGLVPGGPVPRAATAPAGTAAGASDPADTVAGEPTGADGQPG